jgi:hypothetical protein
VTDRHHVGEDADDPTLYDLAEEDQVAAEREDIYIQYAIPISY